MITKYIVGDITETELKYTAQGVNCKNRMGSGVALSIMKKRPEVKARYHEFAGAHNENELLGKICSVTSEDGHRTFNLFTQFDFGYDGKKYVNYAAIVRTFTNLKHLELPSPIAIPKIGCGLAGGNWNFVEQLINDTVGDDLEIWVYEFEAPRSSGRNDLA